MLMLRYRMVDVFTTEALTGNALAVFTDGSELDSALMQKIAREMNLAETTFILPPEDPTSAARLRIFTPKKEMIFAGHPTIGTSFVLLDEERVSNRSESFFLEEKVGKIQIWVEQGERPMIWLRTPPISEGRVFDRLLCAQALGVETDALLDARPQLLDAGNPTLFVALKNKEAVDRAWLDPQGMTLLRDDEAEPFCVFVFAQTVDGAYSRMFAPDYGVAEDPATGSSTGPLAAYMIKNDLLPGVPNTRFISEQGMKMLRRSLLHVKIGDDTDTDGIYVGGHVTPIAEGTMKL
jgi:trans-2,3-dihydro-3-hydroxyanthranilate isomerase